MSNTVSIYRNSLIWNSEISENDYDYLMKILSNSSEGIDFFKASIIPVRTCNFPSFLKDFISPTLINRAFIIKTMALRWLAVIGSFFYDLLTLPIRIITCVPRVITNVLKPDHLLKNYLIQKKVHPDLIKQEYVNVDLYKMTTEELVSSESSLLVEQKDTKTNATVNLIEMPYFEGAIKAIPRNIVKEVETILKVNNK